MTRKSRMIGSLLLTVVAIVAVVTRGSGDPYRLTMRLSNADGLTNGSPVVIGGLVVGKVNLKLDGKTVLARLDIQRRYAPVGRDVTATISARNLLGQKQVRIDPGTTAMPAQSGSTIPDRSVSVAADLDQVLDVLAPDTRARLAVLMNEAGRAVTGRRLALGTFVHGFPVTLERGAALADQLAGENGVLRSLVGTTDRYVATVSADRKSLVDLVDRAGQTAVTVASRRRELRSTLAAAPASLRTLRAFLVDLRRSAQPLGRTARNLRLVAPPLRSTLKAVAPFQQAASPTLDAVVAAAPSLARLGAKATPVLRQAVPTLTSIAALTANELPPTADILDHSFSNFVAVLENWSRAIQFRDRLGHVFRAELAVPVTSLTSAVDRIVKYSGPAAKTKRRRVGDHGNDRPSPSSSPPAGGTPARSKGNATPLVGATVDSVKHELDGILGGLGLGPADGRNAGSGAPGGGAAAPLLDFLLGR